MREGSPFTYRRFEHEGTHLYFLPRRIFDPLEKPRPTFLVGPRGTGKTTLLQALSWNERLNNESLKSQLEGDAFAKRYIGAYVKLPKIQFTALDRWLAQGDGTIYENMVSIFLDLSWVKVLADGVNELLAKQVIGAPPDQEHTAVAKILDRYPTMTRGRLDSASRTVAALSHTCVEKVDELQRLVACGARMERIIESVPLGQIGEFGRFVSSCLGELCDYGVTDEATKWHFKICMDEGECLSPRQLGVLKTMVRLVEWPAFPIVAFVSLPEDLSSTLIPKLTLQQADRDLVNLDDMTPDQFKELAEGVALVRVQARLKDKRKKLDVRKILGDLDINAMLYDLLRQSVSADARALLEKSKAYGKHPFFKDRDAPSFKDKRRSYPIYETYLIEALGIKVPPSDGANWERRKQDCAEIRKRMVAAYLSICSKYTRSHDIMYASADVLLQMSDNCIRDFLLQLEEIFQEVNRPLEEFLAERVSLATQNQALKAASKKKAESIPRSDIAAPKEVGQIVRGLAQVTARIQQGSHDNRHLRSSERGRFRTTFQAGDELSETLMELVRDGAQAGFLRLFECKGSNWVFRVHTSLAAHFGFSYRGAYYPCDLAVADIDRLRKAEGDEDLALVIDDIVRKIQQEPDMPLFKGIADDD